MGRLYVGHAKYVLHRLFEAEKAFGAGVLTGNFVIEKIFNIPGIGQSMILAIQNTDYTMIMGLTIIFAFISIVCYFLVDIVYGLVDPRIRIAK